MNLTALKKINHGYLFIAPFVIGFLIFGLYPVVNTLALSFTDMTLMTREGNWNDFQNFTRLFADDVFMTAVGNTWLLWILNFIPQIGIAMLLSMWFTNARLRLKGVGLWRAMFFLPNLLMPAAVAALFFSLFSYYGPVNQVMVRFDLLPEAVHFLQKIPVARALVIFIQWWMWYGQTTILLMAAITSVSPALYEAALIDGAGTGQIFRYVTLPLLTPIIAVVMTFSVLFTFTDFQLIYVLTRGGPVNATHLMATLSFQRAISGGALGEGAALATAMVPFLMAAILFSYFGLQRRAWQQGGSDR